MAAALVELVSADLAMTTVSMVIRLPSKSVEF
jgi:hypothetical protein